MGHLPEEQLKEAHQMATESQVDNSWMIFICLGAITLFSVGGVALAAVA